MNNTDKELLSPKVLEEGIAQRDMGEEYMRPAPSLPVVTPSNEWDDALLHPRGLVGDVAKWITNSSGMHQPKFALASALTVCGALLARVVKDHQSCRGLLVMPSQYKQTFH